MQEGQDIIKKIRSFIFSYQAGKKMGRMKEKECSQLPFEIVSEPLQMLPFFQCKILLEIAVSSQMYLYGLL